MFALTQEKRISLFRHTQLLCGAGTETLSVLALRAEELNISQGTEIIRQGDITNDIYIIADGEVAVTAGQHTIQTLGPGIVFGLFPLADFRERSAGIVALSDTLLLRLSAEDFYKASENDTNLIRGLAREISDNSRNLLQLHETIANQRDEIEQQKKELVELNKTKDKLFSIMGHDLRSPVASIITLIEILQSDYDQMPTGDIKEMLNDISHLSQIHLKLLENLLQWARLQTGALQFSPEHLLFSEILDETLQICEHKYRAKNISLIQETEYVANVVADKNMIQTVLRNLLTNAGKFTPRGGTVTVKSRKLNDKEVVISVADTGIGMSEQQLGKLFQLDKIQSRYGTENEAGTGLGLIICHDFVAKNKGRIWAESSENGGSTFSFTLPIK